MTGAACSHPSCPVWSWFGGACQTDPDFGGPSPGSATLVYKGGPPHGTRTSTRIGPQLMSTAPELPDPSLPATPTAWPEADESVIALGEALRRAAPRLRRYASRRLGDQHEAEEVVQEALLRACQHAGGFATE